MMEPSERGTFRPLGGESCVYSTTRMNMLSNVFTVFSSMQHAFAVGWPQWPVYIAIADDTEWSVECGVAAASRRKDERSADPFNWIAKMRLPAASD